MQKKAQNAHLSQLLCNGPISMVTNGTLWARFFTVQMTFLCPKNSVRDLKAQYYILQISSFSNMWRYLGVCNTGIVRKTSKTLYTLTSSHSQFTVQFSSYHNTCLSVCNSQLILHHQAYHSLERKMLLRTKQLWFLSSVGKGNEKLRMLAKQ